MADMGHIRNFHCPSTLANTGIRTISCLGECIVWLLCSQMKAGSCWGGGGGVGIVYICGLGSQAHFCFRRPGLLDGKRGWRSGVRLIGWRRVCRICKAVMVDQCGLCFYHMWPVEPLTHFEGSDQIASAAYSQRLLFSYCRYPSCRRFCSWLPRRQTVKGYRPDPL